MKLAIFTISMLSLSGLAHCQTNQDSTKKVKFRYIQIDMTGEQYDTVNYVLSKTMAEFPTAVAAIKLMKAQAHVVTVYDTVAILPKTDSLKVKTKKK